MQRSKSTSRALAKQKNILRSLRKEGEPHGSLQELQAQQLYRTCEDVLLEDIRTGTQFLEAPNILRPTQPTAPKILVKPS